MTAIAQRPSVGTALTSVGPSERRFLILLVGLAIVVRLILLALTVPFHGGGGDEAFYLATARSLLNSGHYDFMGQPTAFRPPGYPAFVALFGASPQATMIGQSLITIVLSVLTYLRLRRFGEILARTTALLLGLSPFLVLVEYRVISEVPYIALLWLAWLTLFEAPTGWVRPVLGGLLLGAAILTRDTLLLLPLFGLAFGLVRRAYLRPMLIAAVVSYAVILPWQVRNMHVPRGGFELSEGRFGYNLWVGTWERNGDWMLPGLDHAAYPQYAFRTPAERKALLAAWRTQDDGAFRSVAIDRMVTSPLSVLKAWAWRYPRLWIGTRSDQTELRTPPKSPGWYVVKSTLFLLNIVTLLLGGIGLALNLRTRWAFFGLPVIYAASIYIPFHNVEPRYSLLAFPFLYLFIGLLLARRFGEASDDPGRIPRDDG